MSPVPPAPPTQIHLSHVAIIFLLVTVILRSSNIYKNTIPCGNNSKRGFGSFIKSKSFYLFDTDLFGHEMDQTRVGNKRKGKDFIILVEMK